MEYQLKKLKADELARLPQNIRDLIQEVKDTTENFDADFLELQETIDVDATVYQKATEWLTKNPKRVTAAERILEELESEKEPTPSVPEPKKPEMSDADKAAFAEGMKKAREAKKAEKATDIQQRWDARRSKAKEVQVEKAKQIHERWGIKKNDGEPTPSVPKYHDGDLVNVKDLGLCIVIGEAEMDDEYRYKVKDGDGMIHPVYERNMKPESKPKAAEKPTPSVKTVTMGKLDAKEMDGLEAAQIGCQFKVKKNETEKTWYIETVVGTITCKPGQYVLYLKGGYPFTVMQKDTFEKRCIKVGKDDTVTIQLESPTGEMEVARVNEATGEVVKAKKEPKKRVSKKIADKVDTLATKMKSEGCDIAQFVKDVTGTPIDDSVWGKIAAFNAKDTQEKIVRIGIDQEGHFIAETLDYGGVFGDLIKDIKFYKVCADEGTWDLIPKSQYDKIESDFKNRKYRSQFSKETMKKYYNYGDPKVKKFDAKLMECQTLSKEAYELRKSGDDASGKYKEHYATCRNQVLNEYNRAYIQGLHALAHKHKEENASLTYRAAFKHIRQELMKKAGK